MKRDYLSRLSRAARWYLPPAEAADVLEDYRDLIEEEPRSEEELRRDLGTPKDAVGQLVQIRAYQRWLAVFALLAVCVLLPAVGPILKKLFWWKGVHWIAQLDWAFLLVGVALSFLWFQRNGRREGTLPRGVLLALLILLAGMAWAWFLGISVLYYMDPLLKFWAAHPDSAPAVIHWSLMLGSPAMGLLGLFGLLKARLSDRRWRAVYILGLTGVLMCLSVWALFCSMNFDPSVTGWQTPILVEYLLITLVGLIGTGVSLC